MEKLKMILDSKVNKKFIIVVTIALLIILGVFSCSIADYKVNKEYKHKQAACEHDYKELYEYENGHYEIYCPKCQLQDTVRAQDWNRIQIDMEYRDKK